MQKGPQKVSTMSEYVKLKSVLYRADTWNSLHIIYTPKVMRLAEKNFPLKRNSTLFLAKYLASHRFLIKEEVDAENMHWYCRLPLSSQGKVHSPAFSKFS